MKTVFLCLVLGLIMVTRCSHLNMAFTLPHQPNSPSHSRLPPGIDHSTHTRPDRSRLDHPGNHHPRNNHLKDPQSDDPIGIQPPGNDRLKNNRLGNKFPRDIVEGSDHHTDHGPGNDPLQDHSRNTTLRRDIVTNLKGQESLAGQVTRASAAAPLPGPRLYKESDDREPLTSPTLSLSLSSDHNDHPDHILAETSRTSDLPDRQRPRRNIPRTRPAPGVLGRSEALSGDGSVGEDPPAEEVAAMISDTVTQHLAGCHKVVLYLPEAPYEGLAGLVAAGLGETTFVWQLDTLLAQPTPSHTILRRSHHRAAASLCVAFILLADLESVGAASVDVQRGLWFAGASKLLLVYTRDDLLPHTLASLPLLVSGHGTALVSCSPRPSLPASTTHHLQAAPRPSLPANTTHHLQAAPRVYGIISTCDYCRGGDRGARVVDEWLPGSGFLRGQPLYSDTLQDFQGHTFNIVTLEYAPFSCYERQEDGNLRLLDCVDTRLLHTLAFLLNFTFSVREPHDLQWGYRLDNGSYTGVIGAVQRHEADFSLNVAFTGGREQVIDYTLGYFTDPLTFCTTKPRLLNQVFALIRPFQPTVWAGFVALLAVMGPLYYLTCLATSRPQPTTLPSLSKVTLDIYGACFSQSRGWWRADGPRVLAASWMFFSLVSLTSYVAMLTASFTLPTLSPTLNTLQELLDSDFSWGIQDQGAADYQLLKTSKVPLYQEVFRGLEVCPSLDQCLTRARDTKYAFITWRLYMEDRIAIRFTSSAGEPQLHVATSDFFPSAIGWAMAPGCPFRHQFNRVMRRLLEGGLVSRWLRQIIHDPARRQAAHTTHLPPTDRPRPLGLDNLQGVFYILALGCAAAIICFMAELWTTFC